MKKFAKYSLKKISEDETYTRYEVKGLEKAYYRSVVKDGVLEDFGGAVVYLRIQNIKDTVTYV